MLWIDRMEGERAVCVQNGVPVALPRAALPEGCAEGDLLVPLPAGRFFADRAAAAQTRAALTARLIRLDSFRTSQGKQEP